MKVFSCKSLGMDCNAALTAATEEKLVELASLHAREVHGMQSLPQEMIGQIKQKMVNKTTSDAASVVDRIFEKYNCTSDPGCTWRYISEAEIIMTGKSAVHEEELKAA